MVLQVAHLDRAVFHATVGLGLLLEDMQCWPIVWPVPRKAPLNMRTASALQHYQKALQQRAGHLDGPMDALSVMSAVLFACIEVSSTSTF